MVRLHGFRPPQFSEEDTWLPCWLQRCSGEWLDVESMQEDHTTFEQRLEEFMDIGGGDSLKDKGGCNIGQLFISGTDSSPFSCAQSAKDVVHFHLCLSSDGDSQNTALSNDACETESTYPILTPGGNFEIQKDINLSTLVDVVTVNCTRTVELDGPDKKIEQLQLDDRINFSEAASDAIELCIAASEALVINDLIDSDSLEKNSSASAILEASLQLKQARWEVCKNTFADSLSVISDTDNLSDLDDITMESVFEDAGVHLPELSQNELSVSQVKDTLESKFDELLEHKKTSAPARMFNSCGDCNVDNDLQLRNNLTEKYSESDAIKKVIHNQLCDGGTVVGHCNDSLRVVNDRANSHPSGSAEKVNRLVPESNPHESHVSSSPLMSFRDEENDNCQSNMDTVKERFQSRWFGGWSSSNEAKCVTTKCKILEPFAGQTSFLSESACTAPDVNSFVQNNKQATVASQQSIHRENFSISSNERMLLSQEAGSSSASFEDPLCSVVPSTIPENLCSSPTLNYQDPILPITVDYKKDNVLVAPSFYSMLAEEEKIARQTADNSDKVTEVYRRSVSLRDYSVLLPSHIELSGKDCHQECSFLIEKNSKLTCQETNSLSREEAELAGAKLQTLNKEDRFHSPSPVAANHRTESHTRASTSSKHRASTSSKHSTAEENPIGEQPENVANHLPGETMKPMLLQGENQSVQKLPAQKRVRFSERETNVPDNKKVRQSPAASKPCYSTRAAKRFTRSSAHLEPRAQQMDRVRVTLDKKRKRLIFQNMDFLLTGFSQQKEKEIDGLIRKYGGKVLSQIPSSNSKGRRSSRSKSRVLPIVLCLKKIQSFKFLYGCAVNAYVLRVNWLIDSIAAGSVLQLNRYMILPRNMCRNDQIYTAICRNDQIYTAVKYNVHSLVFNNLGVMLHGNAKYFTNITTIIKHGGGQVFKTLQGLVQSRESGKISMGVLVAEESCASRHLRHCAMQQNIHITSVYWIIKCLYAGQIIPLEEKGNSRPPPTELQRHAESMELSQEI